MIQESLSKHSKQQDPSSQDSKIEDNNSLSINCIAREVWIDKKKVWLILQKKLKLHPYKQYDVLDLSDWKKEGKVEWSWSSLLYWRIRVVQPVRRNQKLQA